MHIPLGLVQNPPTDKIRNYNTNDMSDTDSVAELNYSAWNDACAGDYQNMLGNIHNPPTCKTWNDDTDHGSDADSVVWAGPYLIVATLGWTVGIQRHPERTSDIHSLPGCKEDTPARRGTVVAYNTSDGRFQY